MSRLAAFVAAPTLLMMLSGLTCAAATDARVRYVDYDTAAVVVVPVQRGVATRIVLDSGEAILADGAATGMQADCSLDEPEWCIRADPGSSMVLVKPKLGATHNNLELRTDRRDYSFHFQVVNEQPLGKRSANSAKAATSAQRGSADVAGPVYRLVFRYPIVLHPVQAGEHTVRSGQLNAQQSARALLAAARPVPRNWRYSMQAMPGASEFVPELVFDDGRFTYFKFSPNRELPTVFYVSSANEEGRVNFHIDEHAPETIVIERLAPRFVLRLGKTAIGIWNDGYSDRAQLAPSDGTAVEGVTRELR